MAESFYPSNQNVKGVSEKLLNKENYIISYELGEVDEDGGMIQFSGIDNDLVSKAILMSDLEFPLPKIEVYIKDVGNQIIPKFKPNGRTYLRMGIIYEPPKESGKIQLNVFHQFLIEDVDLLGYNTEESTHRIIGVSQYILDWNSKQDFSTKGKSDNPIKILHNILSKQTRIPTEKLNEELTLPKAKMTYISPVNSTLEENYNYLIKSSAGDDVGLYFAYWGFISKTLVLEGFNNIVQGNKGTPLYNLLSFPTKDEILSVENSVGTPASNNYLKSPEVLQHLADTDINDFDYMNRSWSKHSYDYKKFMKFLPKEISADKFERYHKEISTEYRPKYKMETVDKDFGLLYDKISPVMLYGDVFQFSCLGNIYRTVGQPLQFKFADSSKMKTRFDGPWVITRIYRSFTRSNYIDNISCVKWDTLKKSKTKKSIRSVKK